MQKKIAIIGTGISGMAAAFLLHRSGADLTIYEKNDYIGGHTRTRMVDYDGTPIAVDTGFIVFNERNYPHLTALFKLLGVEVHKSDMSFGVSIANGRIEWGAGSLGALFGQWQNLFSPRFYKMLWDIRKFFKRAPEVLNSAEDITLGAYLDRLQLGEAFRTQFLLPMGGAIWSCPLETMLQFPAQTFVRFFQNHGLLTITDQPQWYTVVGGSQAYVKKLTAPFADRIHLNRGVAKVVREAAGVTVTDVHGVTNRYDEVIFACHGDEILPLLADADAAEREILGAFRTQSNTAYLHRDVEQMPKRRQCWSSWVYLSNGDAAEPDLAVTYWMNRLQGIDASKPLFVTLNALMPIPLDLTFDVKTFDHPVFDQAAIAAQTRIPDIQGKNRAWFCGAWQRYGFHEDGILSAVKIAKAMGIDLSWE